LVSINGWLSRLFAAGSIVTTNYSWHDSYKTALLESDWTKIEERIQTAESAIHQRQLVLSQDHGGTQEERDALLNAMNGLKVLRADAASWREKQPARSTGSCVAKNLGSDRTKSPGS
jgi:hypothetical protein